MTRRRFPVNSQYSGVLECVISVNCSVSGCWAVRSEILAPVRFRVVSEIPGDDKAEADPLSQMLSWSTERPSPEPTCSNLEAAGAHGCGSPGEGPDPGRESPGNEPGKEFSSSAPPGAELAPLWGSESPPAGWAKPGAVQSGERAVADRQGPYGAAIEGQASAQVGWPQAPLSFPWVYEQPPPRVPRRPPRSLPGWLGVVMAAALVGAAAGGGVVAVFASRAPRTIVREYFPRKSDKVQVGDIQSILASVLPAVVSIDTSNIRGTDNGGGIVQGAGTGMIIEPSGVVLTNNHVITGAQSVSVTLFGQSKQFPARVIGVDAQKDIALVQLEGGDGALPVVHLGNSASTQQGYGVLAIGNALALAGGDTVTEGIVSALNRSLTATTDNGTTENLTGLIQTDAPINPGNSGGPLVDASGRVVAMNTAVATSSQGNAPAQNVGFAIAVDEIESVAAQILHHPIRP